MKDNSDWLEEKCREVIKNLPTRNGYYIVNPNKDCTSLEFTQAIRKQIAKRLPEFEQEEHPFCQDVYKLGFNECIKQTKEKLL